MSVDPNAAKAVFLTAIEQSTPADRTAYLDRACAGDAVLRRRVEALLTAHQEGSFPDFLAAAGTGDDALTATLSVAATPGDPTRTGGDAATADEPSLEFLAPPRDPAHLGRLDHFEVHSVVGQGGMGVVLKALDESLDRIVAIKVLASQYAANATARRRFIREAKAVAAVAHEHVVTVHGVDERVPYLVMQYVSGMSLQDRLDRTGPLERREILRIGMQVAAGLAAAHAQGIVHRDIKPSNILLENGIERVKITDFGLARAVDDASVTQSGVIAGTPMYMSPEQAAGEAVDHRSDLFSLGSVLYAMCTGHAPFRASGTMAVLKRVIEDTPRPIREVNAEVPDWLETIVAKLHAKLPGDRFQTAKEVGQLLEQHLAHLQQPDAVPMPPPVPRVVAQPLTTQRPVRPRWRRRVRVPALLVLLLGAGIGGLYLYNKGPANVYRYLTNQSGVRVELWDPNFEKIIVRKDGEPVATIDGLNTSARLPPGVYELEIVSRPGFQPAKVTYDTRGVGPTMKVFAGSRDGRYGLILYRGDEFRVFVTTEKAAATADTDWVQLFNGKDLTGWKTHRTQPGNWRVEDGILVGSGPSTISHLFTERGDFADFHLRAVVRIDVRGRKGEAHFGNSGIYFRTPFSVAERKKYPTGYEAQILAGDKPPSESRERNLTGSLFDLQPYTREIPGTRAGEWFTLEVIARGKRITIKVNGITTVNEFEDDSLRRGHIALQQIDPDTVVQFRTIEIKELPPDSHWNSLFNGKDLTGWRWVPEKEGTAVTDVWEVSGEILLSKGKHVGRSQVAGDLRTEKVYRNYMLELEWRLPGVLQFNVPRAGMLLHLNEAEHGKPTAVDVRFKVGTAQVSLYRTLRTLGDTKGDVTELSPTGIGAGEWNKVVVTCRDGDIDVSFNGKPAGRVTGCSPSAGFIALHTDGHEFHFRNIRIQELPESKRAREPFVLTPPKVLEHLSGTWDEEITERRDPAKPAMSHTGRTVVEPIAGGRFVRIRTRTYTGGPDYIQLLGFDRDLWEFRSLYFDRNGFLVGPSVGRFDADTRTLTATGPPQDGKVRVRNMRFPDANTFTSDVIWRDQTGKTVVDLSGRAKRRPAGGAIDESATDAGPLPPEMALLDRLVGTWDADMVSLARPGDRWRTEITFRKVLGGRFIEARERVLPSGEENYTLHTFDPKSKSYKQWYVSSRWVQAAGEGTWDEPAKTVSWACTAEPIATTVVWKFATDDRIEFRVTVKDQKGKLLEDLEGAYVRRMPK